MARLLRRWYPTLAALAIVLSVLLVQHNDPSLQWVWIYRWLLMLALMLVFFGLRVGAKVAVLPAVCVVYFALQALGFAIIPMHDGLAARLQTALHVSAFHSALVFVIVPIFMMARGSRWRLPFFGVSCFFALTVAAAILSIACFFPTGEGQIRGVPIFGNPSMTGTFIAIVAVGLRGLWPLVAIVPLLLLGTTTPFAVLLAGLFVRCFHAQPDAKGATRLPMGAKIFVVVLLSGAVLHFGWDKFSSGHGRYHVWKLAGDFMDKQPLAIKLLGAGSGSAPLLVPMLQVQDGLPETSQSFFSWLHNDWLQIGFEQGYIGWLLAMGLYLGACWRSRRSPRVLAMLFAYGVAMTTNYPLRLPLTAFLGIVLLGVAYLEDV